ncbi:MAG: hypothetical protein D6773_09015, partial [Alphaproteobacteria bacterium]
QGFLFGRPEPEVQEAPSTPVVLPDPKPAPAPAAPAAENVVTLTDPIDGSRRAIPSTPRL